VTQIELVADMLKGNLDFLRMTLGDFSDADMLARPTPTANHAAWQLGHLATAESGMVNSANPGAGGELPAGFKERFTRETSSIDDASLFPKKEELIAIFSKVRASTIAWAKTLTPADLDKQTVERMRQFVPTIGHMVTMMPVHVAMHIGQFQVIRRKLGKPIMF
jgi:hypothetical protein